jgi:hypothetical protein
MCYSVQSSLKTTLISLTAIIYLLSSKIPHFQWIAIILVGWCGMQFDELLLWLTNPRKGCTIWNKIITLTLIPLVLMMQPLGSLWGSLYAIPWNKSSDNRKTFMIYYTIFIVLLVSLYTFVNPYKLCTIVTPKGHLYWNTTKLHDYSLYDYTIYFGWAFLIVLPLIIFWNKNNLPIFILLIMPLFAFIYGLYTDGKPSIWCYYTSYASIIAILLLALKQLNIIDIMNAFPNSAFHTSLYKYFN